MGQYAALATIAGSAIANYFGNSDQDHATFANGDPMTDPRNLLHSGVDRSNQLWERMNDPSQQFHPSHLGVQGSPTFDGGGMPMPIGLLGSWGAQTGDAGYQPPKPLGGVTTGGYTPRIPAAPGTTRFGPTGPFGGDGPPANPAVNRGNGNGPGGGAPTRRDPTPGHLGDDQGNDLGNGGRIPGRPGPGQPGSGVTNPPAPGGIAQPGLTLPPGIVPGLGRRGLTAASQTPSNPQDTQNLLAALKLLGVKG
jgi:hypothetical protein